MLWCLELLHSFPIANKRFAALLDARRRVAVTTLFGHLAGHTELTNGSLNVAGELHLLGSGQVPPGFTTTAPRRCRKQGENLWIFRTLFGKLPQNAVCRVGVTL